jgi:tetratricopeptide (TPR) repeat protein
VRSQIKQTGDAGEQRRSRPGSEGGKSLPRSPETGLLFAALLASLVLPLRFFLPVPEPVAFAAALALFLFPGALASLLLLGRRLPLPAHVPVAFALSAGLFALLGLPVLALHRSIDLYLAVCGLALAGSLTLAVVRVLRGPTSRLRFAREAGKNRLWIPFAALAAVLAFVSQLKVQKPNQDIWAYLGVIQDFAVADRLGLYDPYFGGEVAGSSRLLMNGWLVENAGLSRVTGIDPVGMVLSYLTPALIVVGLLAVYALARVLFRNETAALLTGSLTALTLLLYLNSSLLNPGSEFVFRIAEDKYLARFVFTPVALVLAVLFVRERRLRHLFLFAFVCWSVVAVHPLGLALIGIPLAGFCLVHLAINRRNRRSWLSFAGLGAAGLSVGVPPAVYLLATDSPLLSRLERTNENVASSLLESWQTWGLLREVGEETYIVEPSILLNPLVLAAGVGVPLLIWRARNSPAAQLLLGPILVVPVLTFVPPVAGPLGSVIGPWILPRLAWPLSLVAVLVLGWFCWEVLAHLRSRLDRSRSGAIRQTGPFLPLVLVFALAIGAIPSTVTEVRAAANLEEARQDQTYCMDPAFSWMQQEVTAPGKVLAPVAANSCITAHAARADILNLRGQRQPGASDAGGELEEALNAPALDERTVRNLREEEIRYVLLPVGSHLNDQLPRLPGFRATETPGDRYNLYRVDPAALEVTPVITGNSHLNSGDLLRAVQSYAGVLQGGGDEDARLLAYLGLARAQGQAANHEEAASNYLRALEISPEDPNLHYLLGQTHLEREDLAAARQAFETAVELAPRRVEYRQELAAVLLLTGEPRGALEQHRAVLALYPNVPDYRVEMGSALNRAGEYAAADAQFERATATNPYSAELYAEIAAANRQAGRLRAAVAYLEEATELDPNDQFYSLRLGSLYAQLSTRAGGDPAYFELAEDELERAARLEPQTEGFSLDVVALSTLGQLYEDWDRPEEARAAYERALEINPEHQAAREGLERLDS